VNKKEPDENVDENVDTTDVRLGLLGAPSDGQIRLYLHQFTLVRLGLSYISK